MRLNRIHSIATLLFAMLIAAGLTPQRLHAQQADSPVFHWKATAYRMVRAGSWGLPRSILRSTRSRT